MLTENTAEHNHLRHRTKMDRVDHQSVVIQDIVNMFSSGELDLHPWYQRRSVWTQPQKSYLINTIFECKPIPSIYIRHYLDFDKERTIKEVVDGQQRVTTILEYHAGKFPAQHPRHDRPVTFAQLSHSQKSSYLMSALSIGYLVGATDTDVIEIFGRLNSVSKILNPQEKRNAKFSGEFKQFSLREASERVQFWRDYRIFSANDIARMSEVQFVSELVINLIEGLMDYSAKKIDEFYKRYDHSFPDKTNISERLENAFRLIVSIDPSAVRDTIFSRSPLFFSLLLILDSIGGSINADALEMGLNKIDNLYNSDVPFSEREEQDAQFYVACTSNMHRIRSRQIRDAYIRNVLAIFA